jgi:hypothetical protein
VNSINHRSDSIVSCNSIASLIMECYLGLVWSFGRPNEVLLANSAGIAWFDEAERCWKANSAFVMVGLV